MLLIIGSKWGIQGHIANALAIWQPGDGLDPTMPFTLTAGEILGFPASIL
jgi:hypothetical protein